MPRVSTYRSADVSEKYNFRRKRANWTRNRSTSRKLEFVWTPIYLCLGRAQPYFSCLPASCFQLVQRGAEGPHRLFIGASLRGTTGSIGAAPALAAHVMRNTTMRRAGTSRERRLVSPSVEPLKNPCRPHPSAHAHGHHPVAHLPPPHLSSRVAVSLAPVQPSGCPRAMAPPFTFNFS